MNLSALPLVPGVYGLVRMCRRPLAAAGLGERLGDLGRSVARHHPSALAGASVPDFPEPGQGLLLRRSLRLDVHVDQVARSLPLVALHGWLGLQLPQTAQTKLAECPGMVEKGAWSSRAIRQRGWTACAVLGQPAVSEAGAAPMLQVLGDEPETALLRKSGIGVATHGCVRSGLAGRTSTLSGLTPP